MEEKDRRERLERAEELAAEGRYGEAMEELAALSREEIPSHERARVFQELARLSELTGREKEAREFFSRAYLTAMELPDRLREEQAMFLMSRGKYDECAIILSELANSRTVSEEARKRINNALKEVLRLARRG